MARKQARRRKPKSTRQVQLPTIRAGRIVAPLVAVGVIFASYQLSLKMLDREISAIEINGPFQRVSALQIEEAISDEVEAGFVGADLGRIHARIVALPWIDQARVARRWPSRLSIAVTEQVPAAIWGDSGLLNTRGSLFVEASRHPPAELPRLSGPDERSAEVASRYLAVREQLIPAGLDLRRVHLDARGSWAMTLNNGVEVRLGRREIDDRTDLFLDVVANIIAARPKEIDYVDMRYDNGFTIGWADGANAPDDNPRRSDEAMLAARSTD
ncbi:MAG: FtsQ-type POTRA domain-containing protein [Woeseiaceae bacterium]|nr:FtsQ-type POTRA domain-containing protein [Woeseiaceae bacterium]